MHVGRALRVAVAFGLLALPASGAVAHTVTSFSSATHYHAAPQHYRGHVNVVVGGAVPLAPGQIAAASTGAYGRSEITVYAVPSDAARYEAAFGRPLPLRHGTLVLPPATARGDFTYIWATPSGG